MKSQNVVTLLANQLESYVVYEGRPSFSGKPSLKIMVNGVPTNVPPGLNCEAGDFLAVIKRENVEQQSPVEEETGC